MAFDPNLHHRRSIRLRGYDYAQPGAYFVTTVIQGRQSLLGWCMDGRVELNSAGRLVKASWRQLADAYATVEVDTFVVMPNHFHGILILQKRQGGHAGPPLPEIIRRFKSMTTDAYISGVNHLGWPAFERRLWQRGYYEHIFRDETELEVVRRYINNNPANWEGDPERL